MSFLRGRLASTEGAFFLRQSKNAVAKLAEKQPPATSAVAYVGRKSLSPPELSGDVSADVLPEILRHSLPPAVFTPPAESSLSASSIWVLPGSYGRAGSVSADAKNPLRAFVSLPQVTFGPKRWELPTVESSISASTANERRRDRYPPIDAEKVKAAAEGLAHVGKAFAVATTLVFGGAALVFAITASKLELQKVGDIKVKGKDILHPQIEMIKDQIAPLRIWAENTSKKWRLEVEEVKEKPVFSKELSKKLSLETKQ